MANATASYILSAEDRTQAAINSAKRAFKDLDDSVRAGVKSINLLSELFIGAKLFSGVKRLTDSVIEASKANDTQFAASIAHVKSAMDDLMTSKSGLPAATAAMEDLAGVLKDPATVAAADALSSALIRGFAQAAKFAGQVVAGIGLIVSGPSQQSLQIDDQMRALQDERKRLLQSAGVDDPSRLAGRADYARTYNRIGEIDKLLEDMGKKFWQAVATEGKKAPAGPELNFFNPTVRKGGDPEIGTDAYRIKDVADIIAENVKKAQDNTKTATEKMVEDWVQYEKDLRLLLGVGADNGGISPEEYARRWQEYADKVLPEVAVTAKEHFATMNTAVSEMSEYAKRAAQDIQSAFADFLFDPFADGLKGMLNGFLTLIRRMVAEIAAKKILENSGLTDLISTGLSAVFGGGKAAGGPVSAGTSYLVGESGPEIFTAGASGSITPNSALGGASVVINQTIDARGSTNDSVTQLQEVMRQNNAALEARIIDGIRRRRYSLA